MYNAGRSALPLRNLQHKIDFVPTSTQELDSYFKSVSLFATCHCLQTDMMIREFAQRFQQVINEPFWLLRDFLIFIFRTATENFKQVSTKFLK